MKTLLALALLVPTVFSWAQEQPPWHPIENTNSIPTNAITCGFDYLAANGRSSSVHRHQLTSLSVTGYFALSWCSHYLTDVPTGGTLTYYLDTTGFADTATFHLVGSKGR